MVPAYAHRQVLRMLSRSRTDHARRRRLDRRSGYGSGYGIEWLTIRDSRDWVCRQARGRTLELGAGTGLNFPWYPGKVDLVAVDLDRECVEVSSGRAHELDRTVRLAVADGQRLPFGNDTFDTLVCTLAICDVDDRATTLAEAYRVVRPGGLLLLLDHLERRWRRGRPATLGERVGFNIVERQRLWAGYFERVRLQKP
jgi:SAM-dependent methyltransferase